MSYLRYWTHGHYHRLLSWAIAEKVRKGMNDYQILVVYGFDDKTVDRMVRRAEA